MAGSRSRSRPPRRRRPRRPPGRGPAPRSSAARRSGSGWRSWLHGSTRARGAPSGSCGRIRFRRPASQPHGTDRARPAFPQYPPSAPPTSKGRPMTAPEKVDAIVIGAGQAGVPLARALAAAGRRTALVERTHVGGTCINEGCTPTKTMVASARVAYLARRAADYGVRTGPVSVDLARVRERKRAIVESFRERQPAPAREHARPRSRSSARRGSSGRERRSAVGGRDAARPISSSSTPAAARPAQASRASTAFAALDSHLHHGAATRCPSTCW